MNPGVAGFEALFAAVGVGVDVADLVEMGAGGHGAPCRWCEGGVLVIQRRGKGDGYV